MAKAEIQNVYLDTFYVQAYLWGKTEEEKIASETVRKVLKTTMNPQIQIIISMLVMGELINNLMEEKTEDWEKAIENLLEFLHTSKTDLRPPNKGCMKIALQLLEEDERLEPNDILIASQALCDPDSSCFITNDPKILESQKIRNLLESEEIERNRKLRITEEF